MTVWDHIAVNILLGRDRAPVLMGRMRAPRKALPVLSGVEPVLLTATMSGLRSGW